MVGASQATFIKRRSILDSVAVAEEVISHLKENDNEGLLLKVDFKKAFDTLDWDFLLDSLRARCFGEGFIGWVKECLQSSRSALLINEETRNFFRIKRGLKRGCPLSPLLFILTVDILNRSSNLALRVGLISEIGKQGHWEVSNLQLADDTLIYYGASEEEARILKLFLFCFQLVIGLEMNLGKTKAYYIGLHERKSERIANTLRCQTGSLSMNDPGIPISHKAPPRSVREDLIAKIQKRVDGWKNRCLSKVED